MNRNVQGKFALKNDGYRSVRSLRLTASTWEALGAAAQCLGITRADYLEQIVRSNALPSITRKLEADSPGSTAQEVGRPPRITRQEQEIEQLKVAVRDLRQENALLIQHATMALPLMADLEAIRARVLFDLKLGKQASGYKAAQKALNRFIAELTLPA